MCARFGMQEKAYQVLDGRPARDVASWDAIIAASYSHSWQDEESLKCLDRMLNNNVLPNCFTLICLLKACGRTRTIEKGKQIHREIASKGLLEKHVALGNALVDMYAKCGSLEKAQKVLDELPVRDLVSWSAIITGYTQHDKGQQALNCFELMEIEGLSPDAITFTSVLKACGNTEAFDKGCQIHHEILSKGFLGNDTVLGTALVDMYGKCGQLGDALEVFKELPMRCIASWNAVISSYIDHGKCKDALNFFNQMQNDGISPNTVTFACTLKACGTLGIAGNGRRIHDQIIKKGLLGKRVALGNALVDMYVKCHALIEAQKVLDELPVRDAISWNTMIAGFAEEGYGSEAAISLWKMKRDGFNPDAISFICALKACSNERDIDEGENVHCEIINQGLLDKDVHVGTALADMYAKCGEMEKARQVINMLCIRDVASWNALIVGYNQQRQGEAALSCFEQMRRDGLTPDITTLSCVLKACGIAGAVGRGEKVHDQIVSQGLLKKHVVLGNALVDMYVKCGALKKAQKVFDEVPMRDVVSWNVLIAGYSQWGQAEDAFDSFMGLLSDGIAPNKVTFACILRACSSKGAIDKGEQFHELIVSKGLLERHLTIGNALVNMYAKCGVLEKAEEVLTKLPVRDVVSWSALIAGYAHKGRIQKALDCLEQMQSEGLSPDAITLLCILSACSRSGLVNEAEKCFANMLEKYGVTPGIQHYTCMVDLFSRTGCFDKAAEMIRKMPSYYPIWSAVLAACKRWGNVNLGRWAFEQAVKLDRSNATAYAFMANIYRVADLNKNSDAGDTGVKYTAK